MHNSAGRLARFLAENQRLILLAIVGFSLLTRVIYFVQLNSGPCIWQHRWEESDMHFFDAWAQRIAGGDLLVDAPFHPRHGWYDELAGKYFQEHPGERVRWEREAVLAGKTSSEAGRVLWDHWLGGKRFHQEPLYAYLVGLTYKMLGPDVRWVFAWLVLEAVDSDRIRRWFWVGLAGGAALCLKTVFAPFLAAMFLCAFLVRGGAWLLRVRRVAVFVAGLSLALVPAIARNLLVGVPALSITGINAASFVVLNAEDYQPEIGCMVSRHTMDIMAKSDGQSLPAVIETLKTHRSVVGYVGLLWRKFSVAWHWYEQPNNANFYYYRLHAGVLRWLPVTFLVLGPLGLAGLFLALPTWRRSWPLYLVVMSTVFVMLAGAALSRFRIPMQAALVPFAALTVVTLAEWVRARRFVPALLVLLALAGFSAWTFRPLPPRVPLIPCSDYSAAYQVYYSPRAVGAIQRSDWQGAADVLAESLRYEPEAVRRLVPGEGLRNANEAGLADLYSQVYSRRAEALRRAGRTIEADREARRASELSEFIPR